MKNEKFNLILLMGDTPWALCRLREALAAEYRIEEVPAGTEGFKRAKELAPGLVIMEIAVPGMDDWRWCNALKNDDETGLIPLLLLYGEGSEESVIKGLECGVEDCMVRPFSVDLLRAKVKNLVENRGKLLEKLELRAVSRPAHISGNPDVLEFFAQLHRIIEDNLSNPLFSVAELCKKLYMSRATMYRRIRALTGETPQLFIRSYRLMRAAQLLENKCGNVTEVCFRVGFTSTAYFTKCFKGKFHQFPKAFGRS